MTGSTNPINEDETLTHLRNEHGYYLKRVRSLMSSRSSSGQEKLAMARQKLKFINQAMARRIGELEEMA